MARVLVVSALVTLVLLAGGCSGSGARVAAEDYGDAWPFTASAGYLECVGAGGAVFRTGRERFALNGIAAAAGYPRVDPIWRSDPTGALPKVNLGPFIRKARALCR